MPTTVGRDPEHGPASAHEQRLRSLLQALHRRTLDDSLAWEVDDGHPDSYCAIGREGWMIATRSMDGDGQAPYALVIGDPTGDPLLEVTSRSPFGRSMADLFGRLHQAASAAASLASSAALLTTIITELDGGAETGRRRRKASRPPGT